jgi:DNA-binding GntR family transcriptional regulator
MPHAASEEDQPRPSRRQRSRLVDDIQNELRERIFSGRYMPGAELRQEAVAEELDVSRTPLREALRVLQNEGLLTIGTGNRVSVISADQARLEDALVMREAVDGAAARSAATARAEGLELVVLDALEAQRAALVDWDRTAFARADADLHVALLDATRNPYLQAQAPLVRLTIQVFQAGGEFDVDSARSKTLEHQGIVDAVLSADADAAESLARAHIRRVADQLR